MNKSKPSASSSAPVAAQDLWLAGLEAFSQATKAATEAATHAASQAASQVATLAAASAAAQPPSLEGLFEARVAKALSRLGTPTREEIDALSAQVQHLQAALQAALHALEAQPKTPKPKPKPKPKASASAVKRAPAKAAAAKSTKIR